MTNIEGQLNERERRLLTEAIRRAPKPPQVVVEIGTWLGGGSTLHILQSLERNGVGHLIGIEADRSIYDRMLSNIHAALPDASHRFTPMFGFSQYVLREWLRDKEPEFHVDFAFLDGGNNPMEQIDEFRRLDPYIPVGGQLMAHDAKLRKGRWLVPYVSRLDNWESQLHDVSDEGLFYARKTALHPSAASARTAKAHLFRLQCNPAEIAANILPAAVCGLALKIIPRRISRQLSDGRH